MGAQLFLGFAESATSWEAGTCNSHVRTSCLQCDLVLVSWAGARKVNTLSELLLGWRAPFV